MDSSWFPENNNLHHDDHDQDTDHRILRTVDKTSIGNKIMNNKSAGELIHPVSKSLSRQNYSLESALNNTSSSSASTALPSISANIVMSTPNATSSTPTTSTTISSNTTTTRNSVGRLQRAMTLPVQEDSQLLGNTNSRLV